MLCGTAKILLFSSCMPNLSTQREAAAETSGFCGWSNSSCSVHLAKLVETDNGRTRSPWIGQEPLRSYRWKAARSLQRNQELKDDKAVHGLCVSLGDKSEVALAVRGNVSGQSERTHALHGKFLGVWLSYQFLEHFIPPAAVLQH